jgi:serine protease Do
MCEDFVLLRLTYLRGVNLSIFDYDYDQTWMSFFLDADGRVISRYGSRDAGSAEGHNSIPGLLYTMERVLKVHKEESAKEKPAEAKPVEPAVKKPAALLPEDMPGMRDLGYAGTCVRCHMVHEAKIQEQRKEKDGVKRGAFWFWPLPDNVGLKLDPKKGNLVQEVIPESFAAKAGLQKGDTLRSANGARVLTIADLEFVLNGLGSPSELTIEAERDGETVTATLKLEGDWRRWDVSWRKSVRMIAFRTSPARSMIPLPDPERAKLNIEKGDLALRVAATFDFKTRKAELSAELKDAGLQANDVVVAFDGKRKVPYRFPQYFLLLEHIKGDKVEVTYLRNGKEAKATVVVP